MSDSRVQKFAKVLVEHSARIMPGDRVLIEATTAAEPLVREATLTLWFPSRAWFHSFRMIST